LAWSKCLYCINNRKGGHSDTDLAPAVSKQELNVYSRGAAFFISATYLEPLKKGSSGFYIEPWGSNRTFYQKKMVLYRTILEFHIWSGGWNHLWF